MSRKSRNRQNLLRQPANRWDVTFPSGEKRERQKVGQLFDLALEEGMDPGDFVMQSAKIVPFLIERGYTVVYSSHGETEAIELDILDPI